MFKSKSETKRGSYEKGSVEEVQLAVSTDPAKCVGKGNLEIETLNITVSMHVSDLNVTLVSVGQVCDQGRICVFTSKEAVILNLKKFIVDKNDIIAVIPRVRSTSLYAFSGKLNEEVDDVKQPSKLTLWHNRLVHANVVLLKGLLNHVDGFRY